MYDGREPPEADDRAHFVYTAGGQQDKEIDASGELGDIYS